MLAVQYLHNPTMETLSRYSKMHNALNSIKYPIATIEKALFSLFKFKTKKENGFTSIEQIHIKIYAKDIIEEILFYVKHKDWSRTESTDSLLQTRLVVQYLIDIIDDKNTKRKLEDCGAHLDTKISETSNASESSTMRTTYFNRNPEDLTLSPDALRIINALIKVKYPQDETEKAFQEIYELSHTSDNYTEEEKSSLSSLLSDTIDKIFHYIKRKEWRADGNYILGEQTEKVLMYLRHYTATEEDERKLSRAEEWLDNNLMMHIVIIMETIGMKKKENADSDIPLKVKTRQYEMNVQVSECPICFDKLNDAIYETDCKHQFCKECLDKWIKDNDYCPICRTDLREEIQVIDLDEFTEFRERHWQHSKVMSEIENLTTQA